MTADDQINARGSRACVLWRLEPVAIEALLGPIPRRGEREFKMSMIYDVFVSHSHRDKSRAQALVKQLKSWDISVYADFNDAPLSGLPSAKLADHLARQLRLCRLLIFAFSEEAANSRWMPWELGLAHGVVGRAVLWPFTEDALLAKTTQEYLHLYEALDPTTARDRLQEILESARKSAVRPADLKMFEDLGDATIAKLPEFNNPAVASEFSTAGPMQLYSAWLNSITKMWRPPK